MKKVYVSGCFDILHAGHIEFFRQARSLGDFLIVGFASNKVLWQYKKRRGSMSDEHKKAVLEAIKYVDKVYINNGEDVALPFRESFISESPDILATTEDDIFTKEKSDFCNENGCEYVILKKTSPIEKTSTSKIRTMAARPDNIPLRIDFAGGWLDVPDLMREDGYIVNASINWFADRDSISCLPGSGLGGSAAYALLNGDDPIDSELSNGVGWQDPAIIQETGLCVWRSGNKPYLIYKTNGDWIGYNIGLYDTGIQHTTTEVISNNRNYDAISHASRVAKHAVQSMNHKALAESVALSYNTQIGEGMQPLPEYGEIAKKYCGAGFGGYAMYLYDCEVPSQMRHVEIYTRGAA